MELRVLRYFLTVAKEQSFTKAAEQLHITQPTLSRQLAALEEELGTVLFNRGGRNVTLTDEGILLKPLKSSISKIRSGRNSRKVRSSMEQSRLDAVSSQQWSCWHRSASGTGRNIRWFRSGCIPEQQIRSMR